MPIRRFSFAVMSCTSVSRCDWFVVIVLSSSGRLTSFIRANDFSALTSLGKHEPPNGFPGRM